MSTNYNPIKWKRLRPIGTPTNGHPVLQYVSQTRRTQQRRRTIRIEQIFGYTRMGQVSEERLEHRRYYTEEVKRRDNCDTAWGQCGSTRCSKASVQGWFSR